MTAALTTEPTETSCRPRGHDWEHGDAAWGHEADDRACLFEPFAALINPHTGQHHGAATSTWFTTAPQEPTP